MAIIKTNGGYASLPISYKRGNPIPLDQTSIWYSYELMKQYAESDPTAYVGQIMGLVDAENESVSVYVIKNIAGDLKEIGDSSAGTALLGDNGSVVIKNDTISLHNWGVQYYKFIAASGVEGEEGYEKAHYELQIVDSEHPWKTDLEPRVTLEDDKLVLGWYEQNTSTVDGINITITSLQEDIDNILAEIGKPADAETGSTATGLYFEIENQIAQAIANVEHLKRKIVDTYEDIENYIVNYDDADQYIFMVPIGVTDYDNKYSEFIVIDNIIEPVGNWSVNLDDYVKKDELLFTAVSSDYFEVKNKTLSLKPIPMSAIVGLNELNENVVTLNTDVGVLRTDITNLKSVTSELQVTTSELNTKVGNLETNVGTLRTDILNLQTVTGNLQTTTTELNTKVGNLTSSFETLNETVDNHTSKLTEIDDTITNMQSAFDELDGEYVTIDNFNKAVGNIDILLQGQNISSQIEEIRTQLTWQSLV